MCLLPEPHGVSNLTQTQVTTNSVSLKWDQLESKPYYYYNVQAFNSSHSETISSNASSTNKTVDKLESGTNYTFIVTTVTPDGTRSEPSMVSYFTRTCQLWRMSVCVMTMLSARCGLHNPICVRCCVFVTGLLCCSRAITCYRFRGFNLKYIFHLPQLDQTISVQKLLHVLCEDHLGH